jgi:E3 ubiquitin-protein ligase MARCH6
LEPDGSPSRLHDYFDRDEDVQSGGSDYKGKGKADGDTDTDMELEDVEAEHALYFADAEDDDEDEEGMPKLAPPSDSDDDEEGSPRNEYENDDADGDFDMEDEEGEDEDGGDDEGVPFDAEAPIWQAIQIEDDEVAEVGDGEMDAGAPEHGFDVVAPPPVPQIGAGDAGAIDLNDDMDGNVEDDMEGAMEGMCFLRF